MKKIYSLLLVFVVLFSLCACDNVSKNEISNDTEINNKVESEGTLVLDYTDSALIITEEDIEICKDYLSSIKVYLCDYSVFDYDEAVEYEYITPVPTEYPSDKGCSIVLVVDYGSKELKDKFNPYVNLSIPNLALEAGEGVTPMQNSWVVNDTVVVFSHRFNRVVDISEMAYTLNSTVANLRLFCDFSNGVVGFDEAISLLKKHNGGDSVIQVIDGRAYMLGKPEIVDATVEQKTAAGKDKYYSDKTFIYIPLSGGPSITLK